MHGKTDIYLFTLNLKLCLQNQHASDLQKNPQCSQRQAGKMREHSGAQQRDCSGSVRLAFFMPHS